MFYSIFCNFDELSILIIWVRFHTSIFSVVFHLSPFRFALIQNFWYLYSTKFENPKLLINVISQLSRLWNFQFHISAHISNLFLFSTSFSRKWNLNFMFLASSTSNSFNHLGPFLLQHLHLKMFHKPVGFGVPKFICRNIFKFHLLFSLCMGKKVTFQICAKTSYFNLYVGIASCRFKNESLT